MKRLSMVLVAVIAFAALGLVSTAIANHKTKVDSTVTLFYKAANGPYGQAAFKGKVSGKKNCEKNRKVRIKGVGSSHTDDEGKYKIGASSSASGKYTAKVKKKKINKNGHKIVCRKTKASITISG